MNVRDFRVFQIYLYLWLLIFNLIVLVKSWPHTKVNIICNKNGTILLYWLCANNAIGFEIICSSVTKSMGKTIFKKNTPLLLNLTFHSFFIDLSVLHDYGCTQHNSTSFLWIPNATKQCPTIYNSLRH
jgi:hypothetical protein